MFTIIFFSSRNFICLIWVKVGEKRENVHGFFSSTDPILCDKMEGTDFGHPDLTNFGQSNLGQSILGHRDFGPANLGQSQFGPIQFWIWCVSWPPRVGPKPRKNRAQQGGAPKGGEPNISSFFGSVPPEISLSLSGCLLVEFWWCFWRSGPSNVHVWALGLSCGTPGAPPDRAAGASHDNQRTPNVHIYLSVPALQTPPKFHETGASFPRTALPLDALPLDALPPDRPKFRAFSSLSCHNVRSFCLSLSGCLLVELWCLWRPGPSNVHVWSSRVVVWSPGGPEARKHTVSDRKRAKLVAGDGKKREILGGPAEGVRCKFIQTKNHTSNTNNNTNNHKKQQTHTNNNYTQHHTTTQTQQK